MTRLLVSVRSVAEAEVAWQCGADLIDIKEPERGPLGAADAGVIEAIGRRLGDRVPISAALGELREDNVLSAGLGGVIVYAKYGLAGCCACDDWRSRWLRAIEGLPLGTSGVAVAYADWRSAAAPDPRHVLEAASNIRCGAILLDTFDKTAGSLLAHLELDELRAFIKEAKWRNLLCVLAGSLGTDEIARLLPLAPDFVGVRSAVCAADRASSLVGSKVQALTALVSRAEQGGRTPRAGVFRPA